MKKYIILLLPIIIMACSNNTKMISENAVKFSLGAENNNILKSFIDSITLVQLKGGDKAQISYIKKLVVVEDKLFISDFNMKRPILVFDTNGTFLNEIGSRGNSKSEFIMITDYSIDNDYVYTYDGAKKTIIQYTHSGKYVKTNNVNFSADAIQKTNTGFMFSVAKEENKGKIITTDNNLEITNNFLTYLPSDKDDKLSDNIFQKSNDNVFYNKPIDNSIYKFNVNGECEKEYYFDFGNKNVPLELSGNYEEVSKIKDNNSYIYLYDAPFIVGNLFIGKVFTGGKKAVLAYNTFNKEYCINELIESKVDFEKIIFPLCVTKSTIIGYIDLATYSNMINKPNLSKEQMSALNDGAILLSLYHLKNMPHLSNSKDN